MLTMKCIEVESIQFQQIQLSYHFLWEFGGELFRLIYSQSLTYFLFTATTIHIIEKFSEFHNYAIYVRVTWLVV